MRVCFAAYPTAFQQPGGGERVLLSLAEALSGHVDEVVMFDPMKTLLSEFDVLHYFSSHGSELFPEWRRHTRRLAVTPFIWPELPRRVRALRKAHRTASHVARRATPSPYDAVDVIFPTSSLEASLLVRNYHVPRERIVTVPHGADLRFKDPASGVFPQRHGLARYVLVPGRVDPNKNQLRVVRALAKVDLDVVVLGDTAAGQEQYAAACRTAAGPRTRFLPALPHDSEDLRDAFASAACVVIGSEHELCSVAALEAGVAGVPLASTAGGGMVEHLTPYAEFFDPHDETRIRAAVVAALDTGKRPGQSEHFARRFSWDEIARRTAEAYASVS